jgi:hypothetical protein
MRTRQRDPFSLHLKQPCSYYYYDWRPSVTLHIRKETWEVAVEIGPAERLETDNGFEMANAEEVEGGKTLLKIQLQSVSTDTR